MSDRYKRYREKNRERVLECQRQWRERNREYLLEDARSRYWSRSEEDRATQRTEQYQKHAEKRRQYASWYRVNNKAKVYANNANRRAQKQKAMPIWADSNTILEFYNTATLLSQVTGSDWHVDHIFPLRGENVCGLHVENNLQVVPASLNQRKSNKLIKEEADD